MKMHLMIKVLYLFVNLYFNQKVSKKSNLYTTMVIGVLIFQREILTFCVTQFSIQNCKLQSFILIVQLLQRLSIQKCNKIFSTLVVTPALLALSVNVA